MVYITRKERFNAAHKLWVKSWSDEKNLEVFGKCANKNWHGHNFTLYVVGNNLLNLKRPQEALAYFERAISMGERYGFYNNLSDIYISMIDLYTDLNEYEAAEIAGEKAIKYANLIKNDFLLMRSWLAIGRLKLFQGKNNEAIEILKKKLASLSLLKKAINQPWSSILLQITKIITTFTKK